LDFDIERILKYLPGIIIGLTIHEFSHAWVALRSGDSTSRDQGRITLNPLKHIDLLGFIFLIFAGFGWAKPVQFNEENLKKKTDVIKIALAGPISNALLAMLLSLAFVFTERFPALSSSVVRELFFYAIYINWGLFIFNLIPLPPLDGSHLLFFPLRKYPAAYNASYKYGSFLLFGLLIATSITKINFLPIISVIQFFAEGFLRILGYN
jgi:Zn-dependent protease